MYQPSLPDMKKLELSELLFTLIEDLSGKEEMQQEQVHLCTFLLYCCFVIC